MSKIKYFLQQSWLLIIAAFCFGLLIAVANAAWAPRIEANRIRKLNDLMQGLLTNAESFPEETKVKVKSSKGKESDVTIYKALADANDSSTCIGWAFNASGPGFADKIELVVAVDKDFETFAGFSVLSSNETPGFGDQIQKSFYRNQYINAPMTNLELVKTGDDKTIDAEIVAISGATVSSEAVVNIINNTASQIKTQMKEKGLL
jgi:electron transport complex protein RnfG